MILLAILMLAMQVACLEQSTLQELNFAHQYEELARIDTEIQRRTAKKNKLELKLSRLFEHSIKHNEQNLDIDDISLLPSISVPYKDNIYYSMLLKKNQNLYTLRGDTVLQPANNQLLISSIRNQHTYFAEFLPNSTIKISKLKVITKKTQIQLEININVSNYENTKFDFFVFGHHSTFKYYLFASSMDKVILVFEKNGTLCKSINVDHKIVQMKKINNNIVVLTEQELFFLNINKNLSRTPCMLPYGSIEYFSYDQSNYKYIYGKQRDSIFQFELYANCRPINSFHILQNSSFHIVGQLLFLFTPNLRYAINITNRQAQSFQFPFGQCLGDKKIEINRKIQSNYMVSQVCLGQNQINMTHILVQFEDSSSEVTDFSKFRIPLLFFSFGIIIYVTVKNKNKNKPEEEMDDNAIQENILKKMANLKEQASAQPLQPEESLPKHPPLEKKTKKN